LDAKRLIGAKFMSESKAGNDKEAPATGHKVGIDDISVYVPGLYLPLEGEFSRKRGIDPGKLLKGIGIERMAVADAHEDAATMAANALLDLMKRSGTRPEEIGKIYVGTESAPDEAKALGTYVIGMMEQVYGRGTFQECETVEFKAACIGTTFALESLCYWLAAEQAIEGEEKPRVGVVIASDIARYPLCSPGEYTQGAGSVALLVKANPRLLAMEQIYGAFSRNENDFFRPMGCTTAVVNGKHSNQCYLDAVQGAFDSFIAKASRRGIIRTSSDQAVTDFFDHLLFHIPYPRMIEYASAAIFRHDWKKSPTRRQAVEAEIGSEPQAEQAEGLTDPAKLDAARADYSRRFSKSRAFLQAFEAKVKDTGLLSRQVGNIYTGSIYLGLASLMEAEKLKNGERLGFAAYGSGCSALFFSAIVQPAARNLAGLGLLQRLGGRQEISLADYERLHEGKAAESIRKPGGEFILSGVDGQGYRHYEYVEQH
jgi:hydroxymethylglutaryl-CoA synthase